MIKGEGKERLFNFFDGVLEYAETHGRTGTYQTGVYDELFDNYFYPLSEYAKCTLDGRHLKAFHKPTKERPLPVTKENLIEDDLKHIQNLAKEALTRMLFYDMEDKFELLTRRGREDKRMFDALMKLAGQVAGYHLPRAFGKFIRDVLTGELKRPSKAPRYKGFYKRDRGISILIYGLREGLSIQPDANPLTPNVVFGIRLVSKWLIERNVGVKTSKSESAVRKIWYASDLCKDDSRSNSDDLVLETVAILKLFTSDYNTFGKNLEDEFI